MTPEAKLQYLADREEIRELAARYAHAIALGDGAGIVDLFTDDAVFTTRMPHAVKELPDVLRGRDELAAFYKTLTPGAALPCVHNHILSVEGDEAAGTCTLEVRLTLNGRSMIGAGYYEDRYRRVHGRWRFTERLCTFFHVVPLREGWAES